MTCTLQQAHILDRYKLKCNHYFFTTAVIQNSLKWLKGDYQSVLRLIQLYSCALTFYSNTSVPYWKLVSSHSILLMYYRTLSCLQCSKRLGMEVYWFITRGGATNKSVFSPAAQVSYNITLTFIVESASHSQCQFIGYLTRSLQFGLPGTHGWDERGKAGQRWLRAWSESRLIFRCVATANCTGAS